MGYEVGFARVRYHPVNDLRPQVSDSVASASASAFHNSDINPTTFTAPTGVAGRVVKTCDCRCDIHTDTFTNFDAWDQESFNSRLKAEGDDTSTNLYISNLPKSVSETDLQTIFCNYTILSAKVLRDALGNSRGVGFAR
jgi:hypothetical protein